MSAEMIELRWERYVAMFGDYGMPREAFDAISAAEPYLGSRGLHRVWVTPEDRKSTGSGS